MTRPRVLFVLSSHPSVKQGDKDQPVGWYLPEFAHPYYKIAPVADIVVASTAGGYAQVDPQSVEMYTDQESTKFLKEKEDLWKNTPKLSDFKGKAGEFDAIFYVGGVGPMFDLANNQDSGEVIRNFWEQGKIVAAVCHGPAALANVKLSDGSYLIEGSAVTGFTDAEEEAIQNVWMPFSLEEQLIKNGGKFEKHADVFGDLTVVGKEGRLLTGQNPTSAGSLGAAVVKALGV